jgi:hypothetical protein
MCTACSRARALGATGPPAPMPQRCTRAGRPDQPISTARWRPRGAGVGPFPGASEPFIPLLWRKVHEPLRRAAEGSTARLVHGMLPGAAPAPSAGSPAETLAPKH